MNHVLFRTSLCFVICSALMFVSVSICEGQTSAPSSPQADSEIEKIKAKVNKIRIGKDLTVNLKGGGEYYGSLQNIDADSFKIYEVDLKQLLEIKYSEVKSLSKGYGHSRAINGKRISPRKQWIALGALAGVLLIPILIVVTSKD